MSQSMPLTTAPAQARGRRWQIYALFILASTLLALLAVEVIARFVFRKYADDRAYFEIIDRRILDSFPILDPKGDEKFGAAHTPNVEKPFRSAEYDFVTRTNSLGFRTREIEPKVPGEWRVMLVGDSFFEGFVKTEDTVDHQLERLAARTPGLDRPLRVYNFARYGYTTVQELIVAKTYAPMVKPDQIIVGYLAANDTIPNAVTSVDRNDNLAISERNVKRVQAEVRSRIGWWRHSMIFRVLSVSPYTTRLYYQIAAEPFILEKNYALFEQFQAYCAENQIELTFLMMHCKDGVRGGLHGAWTQSRPVVRSLVDYCRGHGIDAIDMLDDLHGPQAVAEYYYPVDGHPNARGCERIAQTLFTRAIIDHLRDGSAEATRLARPDSP